MTEIRDPERAIIGPLAFRALKLEGETWKSPLYSSFEWTDKLVANALCSKGCADIPGIGCRCGFYGTYDIRVAYEYQTSRDTIITLNEGTGNVELYTEGFRSQQLVVRFLINTHVHGEVKGDKLDPHQLALFAAREYFGIKIISLELAQKMIEIQKTKWYEGDN